MKKQPYILTAMLISALAATSVIFSGGISSHLASMRATALSYGVTFAANKNKLHSFLDDTPRDGKATDYAMAKNVYAYEGETHLDNSIYWTRSPDSEYRVYVSSVSWDGKMTSEHATKNRGVRPCITLAGND